MVLRDTELRPTVRPPRTSMVARAGWPVWAALGLAVAFVVLTVLVATGVTASLDSRVIHALRPTSEWWGDIQNRWSPWMSRLNPRRMYLMLAVTSLVVAAWRRSWRPVLFGGVLAVSSVGLTVLVKFALERPDPFGYVTATGGSYPSGHLVALVVCSAGCLLLVFRRVRAWMWVPVAIGVGLLTAGLLVAAAHWPTDVLGGILLALAIVSAGSRLPLRRWHASAATPQSGAASPARSASVSPSG